MRFTHSLKNAFAIGSLCLASATAIASEQTDKDWSNALKEQKIPASEQAYCYTDQQGKLQGANLDLRIRLASVSKLMTSLWANEILGPNYKYETKLFIKGNNLHISGSFDPFLGNQKMFYLVSQLNDLGFTKFDKITFDKEILINPSAQKHTDQYPLITRASNARNIKMYFNTKSWSSDFKAEYVRIAGLAKSGTFRKEVNFEIGDAVFSETNPFEGDTEAKMLTLSSPPLYKYLKEINVQSNNYASHTIFRQLGGEAKFQEFMAGRYGLSNENIRFWTGSGLPVVIDGVRKDNYATCAIVTNLIAALKESADRQGREIEDIVAVPGSDGGTFRNRTFPADFTNAFVAKTGTLMHTSTLAGALSTKNGFSFYGVFNQSTDIYGSKIVQNTMVKSMMIAMGGPKAFNYRNHGFDTYGTDTVKSLHFGLELDEASDFIPFEQNLY